MSFGFSVGDAILLTQLTNRAYNAWKNACGEYTSITGSLGVLNSILERVQVEIQSPNSVFSKSEDDLRGWQVVSADCSAVVTELEGLISKYKSLSTSKRRNWDKIRMAGTNLDSIHRELVKKT